MPNVYQLIIARAVVGGALLVPGSLAIISASFRDEQRGQAVGTWAGFTLITRPQVRCWGLIGAIKASKTDSPYTR